LKKEKQLGQTTKKAKRVEKTEMAKTQGSNLTNKTLIFDLETLPE